MAHLVGESDAATRSNSRSDAAMGERALTSIQHMDGEIETVVAGEAAPRLRIQTLHDRDLWAGMEHMEGSRSISAV